MISEIGGEHPQFVSSSDYGTVLQHAINVENATSVYAQRISDVFNQGSNVVVYPNTSLADQLRTVARLISGGSQTKIFLVRQNGYDTMLAANP